MKRLTYIVLGAFLVLTGLAAFVTGLNHLGLIIGVLAIASGIMILVFSPGISSSIGWIAAAVYLIVKGLASIIGLGFAGMDLVMAVLALAAGVLLLIVLRKINRHIGLFLFTIWLILDGLHGLIGLGQLVIVVALVAIASGILIILDK